MLPLVPSTIVPPGRRLTLALGRLDHRQPDPIFHAPAGVHKFDFRQQRRPHAARDFVQAHQRCIADRIQDRFFDISHASLMQAIDSGHVGFLLACDRR